MITPPTRTCLINTPPLQSPPLKTPRQGSPNTYLHEPILAYLRERGVTLHLNTRIQELVYDVDASGAPTRINGFVTSGGWVGFVGCVCVWGGGGGVVGCVFFLVG